MISDYTFSTDKSRLDVQAVHKYLSDSYWAEGIPVEIVKKSIENSFCFGVYFQNKQVGFARVVTDFATFGYLADVFIIEGHRGKGLSKKLMEYIMSQKELQGLRRFMLATRDAHKLYEQYGFKQLAKPERIMEIVVPNIYLKK